MISLWYYHLKTLVYVILGFCPTYTNLNNTFFTVAIIIQIIHHTITVGACIHQQFHFLQSPQNFLFPVCNVLGNFVPHLLHALIPKTVSDDVGVESDFLICLYLSCRALLYLVFLLTLAWQHGHIFTPALLSCRSMFNMNTLHSLHHDALI